MKWISYLDLRPGLMVHGIEQNDRTFVVLGGIVIKEINDDHVVVQYQFGETEQLPLNTNFWIGEDMREPR